MNYGSSSGWSSWLNNEKKLLDASSLNVLIESNKLSAGNMYSKSQFSDFVSSLKTEYNAAGYYNAKIDSNVEIDSQNRIGIEINIYQGKRATISSMTISGANKLSEKELLELFSIGEADMLLINYFTNKDRYSDLAVSYTHLTLPPIYSV